MAGRQQQIEFLAALPQRKSQKEIRADTGASQSTVSEWFAGKKKPDIAHTALLARSTGADPYALAVATGNDPDRVLAVARNSAPSQRLIILDHAAEELEEIRRVRTNGDPRGAYLLAAGLARLVRRMIETSRVGPDQGPLLEALVWTLYEEARCLREILYHTDVRRAATPLAAEMHRIAEVTGREEHEALAAMTMGHAHYIGSLYGNGQSDFEYAILLKTTPDERLIALRTLALTYALDNMPTDLKTREVKRLSRLAGRLVERGQHSTLWAVAACLEGLGRAHGMLDLDAGLAVLEEARAVGEQISSPGEQGPLLPIQIEISTLEVLAQHKAVGLTELERGVSRVAARATEMGYDKYAERAGAILRRAGQPKGATPGGGRSGPSASLRRTESPGSVR